jgi:glycolate oxidase iron-sulfur subunit
VQTRTGIGAGPDPALIKTCIHCGFCLPTCPTYLVWGEEMDSPRGRIVLMRQSQDDGGELGAVATHIDRCLGCMACVTACPSGVRYDVLIEQMRPEVERRHRRTPADRAFRRFCFEVFTHPGRLRALVPALVAGRRLGLQRRLQPKLQQRFPRLAAMARVTPDVTLSAAWKKLPERTPARPGTARGTVGLLQGCVARVFFARTNEATIRVLAAEGFDVVVPPEAGCCGALLMHSGAETEARQRARATIAAFEGCDTVAVNAAGCGSAMKEYGRLLASDQEWAERAEAFVAKVKDVTEVLAAVEPRAARHPVPLTVAYHDACHLAHAQGVRAQPRTLLGTIPGLTVLEPKEWEICCGSAGLYNLLEPEPATELGRRKVANLTATGAAAVVAGNPGCALQIAAHSAQAGHPLAVYHPIELLDASISGRSLP